MAGKVAGNVAGKVATVKAGAKRFGSSAGVRAGAMKSGVVQISAKRLSVIVEIGSEIRARPHWATEMAACFVCLLVSGAVCVDFTAKGYVPDNALVMAFGLCPVLWLIWETRCGMTESRLPLYSKTRATGVGVGLGVREVGSGIDKGIEKVFEIARRKRRVVVCDTEADVEACSSGSSDSGDSRSSCDVRVVLG